ncbi:MAG: ABC transporter permease subunit [Lachnospiraceae bacterium]|nr:ABC transporter permease subunit [Lachnospiraceae bacterium]
MKDKNYIIKVLAVVFWIGVWQIASMLVGKEVLVASPIAVIKVFSDIVMEKTFWASILSSLLRIAFGFGGAVLVGTLLAVITCAVPGAFQLFYPIISVIKATPVASFIILALLWIKSTNVPMFIAFLMVLPIIWSNVSTGIKATDTKLLEMAKVYNFGYIKTIRLIYIPQCMDYFYTASIMGIGFAWKAGIAAEVICTPKFSVGANLYNAKIYLETPQLFAWTIVVILMSIVFEKMFEKAMKTVFYKHGTGGEK